MNKIGNLLWKIFSATMVFFYNTNDSNSATCNTTINTNINPTGQGALYFVKEDGTHITDIANQNSTDIRILDEKKMPLTDKDGCERDPVKQKQEFTTKKICNAGEYLASCNKKVIGTNWLKGLKTPENYFSYGDSNDTLNMTNLRKFFSGTETITYMQSTNCVGENYTNCEYTPKQVGKDTYVPTRNEILTKFCTDGDGKLFSDKSFYVCSKCPSNATIAASTVMEDTYATGKIFADTWNIHTIADCYMNEFSDTSGTFIYVPETNFAGQTVGMPCYYSTHTYGSSLK